jgi:signal transduction histidine kinase
MAMVGKLAAGMAHSVRNPLTSVKMRLFTLNRTLDLSEDQSEDFKVISEEIEHIDTIVGNFLEFSRPPKLQMQTTSPSSVVDMMMQLLKHRLRAYDVTATIGREKMLPEIHGDPEQLKEVLVNLVENACQATGKGGQIRIKEENWVDEMYKKWCIIHIEDNGPGIPEDVAEHVFNPFYTTKGDGTGLGLSIAERIISNHGGKIKLRSIPGEGTVFSVFLPVEEDKTGANDADSSDY